MRFSVNPVDYKSRAPKEQVEPTPRILGWDAAGVVRAVGSEVTLFKPGDEVYYAGSIKRPGANAELHLVDERIVGKKPKRLGFAEAAALPLTALTAWESLFDRLGISSTGANAGKSVLLIGGVGGVGSIAIQLAKRVAGLRVVATASRPESAARARELGADEVLDHSRPLDEEQKRVGLGEVDYIVCFNAIEQHYPSFAPLIRPEGRICGVVGPNSLLPLGTLMLKSVTFVWELMFTRPMFETPSMIEQHRALSEISALIDRGALGTTLGAHYGPINASNLRRAHSALEAGHTLGKIVLEGFAK
ncbi:MAG: zinc-binding alcohol dehydrogenase family protein [Polyangiaceae bacterium]